MPWFDDVQIFLIIILVVIVSNFVLFLVVVRKSTKEIQCWASNNSAASNGITLPFSETETIENNGKDREKRVLFILKDLSDLVLYFGPILLAALRNNCDIFLLIIQPCSGGRYFWFKNCIDVICQTLGLSSSNVVFVWDEHFPAAGTETVNDPWPIPLLMHVIHSYAVGFDVDYITTYDCEGINDSHARQAINESVNALWRRRMLPKRMEIYLLTSTSTVQAFAGLLDTPFSCLSSFSGLSSGRLVSSLSDILLLQKLYLLCEWRTVSTGFPSAIKIFIRLILNRYFLVSNYHKIQDEEKYRL